MVTPVLRKRSVRPRVVDARDLPYLFGMTLCLSYFVVLGVAMVIKGLFGHL